jgi:hypothetical protein
MAKRRVQRGGADERRYPTMQLARELVHGTGATRVQVASVRHLTVCIMPSSCLMLHHHAVLCPVVRDADAGGMCLQATRPAT